MFQLPDASFLGDLGLLGRLVVSFLLSLFFLFLTHMITFPSCRYIQFMIPLFSSSCIQFHDTPFLVQVAFNSMIPLFCFPLHLHSVASSGCV